jgi:regulatory protein
MSFGKPKKPFTPLDENALREYAVQSLGRRARSEADLRRLMRAKVEPDENGAARIDKVIARLKEYGYLDDQVFAENYTQLRQQNEKFGARRVQQELNRKGIAKQTIADTIEAKYSEINEETLAREHLDRKRIRKPENEKETARVMRRLVAAGFSVGVIYKILRQWDVPEESLTALESLDLESESDVAGGGLTS